MSRKQADIFEDEVDHIISLCLRYSWSEKDIVKALEKLRDRFAPIIDHAPEVTPCAPSS